MCPLLTELGAPVSFAFDPKGGRVRYPRETVPHETDTKSVSDFSKLWRRSPSEPAFDTRFCWCVDRLTDVAVTMTSKPWELINMHRVQGPCVQTSFVFWDHEIFCFDNNVVAVWMVVLTTNLDNVHGCFDIDSEIIWMVVLTPKLDILHGCFGSSSDMVWMVVLTANLDTVRMVVLTANWTLFGWLF